MSWHCKTTGAYLRTSSEAIDNAKMIYSILSGHGWTLNAVCGLLGNIGHESGYNPWRWQSDNILAVGSSQLSSKSHGYGLVQFTPANKYILNASGYSGYGPNYSNQTGSTLDGQAQMNYMNSEADYYPSSYSSLTYSQYKSSTLDAGSLAKIWLHNYERPASASSKESTRAEEAEYWYTTLGGTTPEPSPTTHSITVTISGNGTAYATPSTADAGAKITLHETAYGTDTFTGFTVISGGVTISTDFTFTMPDSDVVIQANFTGETPPEPTPTPETHSIILIIHGKGTAYATPSTATEGWTVTLHETPARGERFYGFKVREGDITISSDFSFTMPDSDVIIDVWFKKKSKWIYAMRPLWTVEKRG